MQDQNDFYLREAVLEAIDDIREVRESGQTLEITVNDAVVTISGTTFTEIHRRRILYAAATVPGVAKVMDNLYDDEDLKGLVAQALADHETLGALDEPLLVACYQGRVTLSGDVMSAEQQTAAIATASAVKGVRQVLDNLTVMESA